MLGLRERHQYSDQRSNQNRAPCVASTVVEATQGGLHHGRGVPNGQIVSLKNAADGRRQRSRKIINEEREKYRAKNGSLRNTLMDSKEVAFVIWMNHASTPIRKERLSPTSKARREASRNELVEKGGIVIWSQNFREINSRQDRPRARPGFVKPIRNGLRKEQNLH